MKLYKIIFSKTFNIRFIHSCPKIIHYILRLLNEKIFKYSIKINNIKIHKAQIENHKSFLVISLYINVKTCMNMHLQCLLLNLQLI